MSKRLKEALKDMNEARGRVWGVCRYDNNCAYSSAYLAANYSSVYAAATYYGAVYSSTHYIKPTKLKETILELLCQRD